MRNVGAHELDVVCDTYVRVRADVRWDIVDQFHELRVAYAQLDELVGLLVKTAKPPRLEVG
jgi:hypothetical protein